MKRSSNWCFGAVALLATALGGALLTSGCEDILGGDDKGDLASVEGSFRVSPSSYNYSTASVNTVPFKAVGGQPPYTWTAPTLGTITPTTGPTVNYTPGASLTYGAVDRLKVTDNRGWSAVATISRKSSKSTIDISPSSRTYSATSLDITTFSVRGGAAPYTWSVSDSSLGTLSATSGTSVNYTPTAASTRTTALDAVNVVTVADSQGWKATASVRRQR